MIRLAFLSCLAILAGVASVSIPIMGKTVAEHVHGVAAPLIAGLAAKYPVEVTLGHPDRPPADELTDEDRQALERILGERAVVR